MIVPSPRIRRVFEITGLDKIFDIYGNEVEAKAEMLTPAVA